MPLLAAVPVLAELVLLVLAAAPVLAAVAVVGAAGVGCVGAAGVGLGAAGVGFACCRGWRCWCCRLCCRCSQLCRFSQLRSSCRCRTRVAAGMGSCVGAASAAAGVGATTGNWLWLEDCGQVLLLLFGLRAVAILATGPTGFGNGPGGAGPGLLEGGAPGGGPGGSVALARVHFQEVELEVHLPQVLLPSVQPPPHRDGWRGGEFGSTGCGMSTEIGASHRLPTSVPAPNPMLSSNAVSTKLNTT